MAPESYITLKSILDRPKDFFALIVDLLAINQMQKIKVTKTLFTWSGGTRSSGVGFFCFVSPRAWKQKKPTPLYRGPPLHVNRP